MEKNSIELKKTPLFEVHQQLRAKMTVFAGWQMPLLYSGIIPEHLAVRRQAGLFDISHMGKIEIKGGGASELLEFLFPSNISSLTSGQVAYSFLCNENGGLIDDLTIFCFSNDHYFLCVNAACAEKDLRWIKSFARPDVIVSNVTREMAILALQGPLAGGIMDGFMPDKWEKPKRFRFSEQEINGKKVIISRTGYTGEDGFELFCSSQDVVSLWQVFMRQGEALGLKPCGLGARDTLRLEMAFVLYGEDINENVTLLEARFGKYADFSKGRFIGKDALLKEKEKGPLRQLVGFLMEEKGIPRKDYPVFHDGEKIGFITSGSISPILNRGIGLGLIHTDLAINDQEVEIGIREKRCKAKVVLKPFTKLSQK
ncbi:MAG: glycine cleavage system aminomethyltransferase GcvT [Candidatus Tectomicrobia bacterium]|uniref:Aminomethyltransferase n=1 Tax=Tectimicrobiota bacterium TaxID=2528274 RepID=A0A933LQ66_UNCTE|nr:glycine cleavage system aminomethyltransferase GcvT [Candidatus Tectomicrobia bacterium]